MEIMRWGNNVFAARTGPRFVIAQRAFKLDPAHDALYVEIVRATSPSRHVDNAVPLADEDQTVVCAFERTVIEELARRADGMGSVVFTDAQTRD